MNHLVFIEPAFAVRFATTLLHFLWQGCLIAVLAMAGEMLLARAAAHWRYVLHVSAFLLMAACMPVTLFCVATGEPPAAKLKPHTEARRRGETERGRNLEGKGKGDKTPVAADFANRDVAVAEQRAVRPGETEQPDSLEPAVADTSPVVLAPSEPVFAAADGLSLARSLRQWSPHITAAYFACLAMLLARLIYGAWGGYRLRQKSDAITDEPLLAALKRQTRRLGLRTAPAIAWCAEVSVPVVIGVVRPMILLPAAVATGLSLDQLESLITHELAHVRRWDLVVNLLQRLIESALFFHPAVWLISRRIDREREQACDELVLATGCGRAVYADSLVRMAEISSALRGLRPTAQATSLSAAGARPSELKRRVLKILGAGGSSNLRPGRMTVLLVVVAMVLAAGAGATWMQFQAANAQSPEPAGDAGGKKDNAADRREADRPALLAGDEARGRAELERRVKEDPQHIHATARFTNNNLGWKWSVYLPPAKQWKLYARVGRIPRHAELSGYEHSGCYPIERSEQAGIIDLEGFVNRDLSSGKLSLWIEADSGIFWGSSDSAKWPIASAAARKEVADYIRGVTQARSTEVFKLGVGTVTTINAGRDQDRLELVSYRFRPMDQPGDVRDDDLLPGFCLWIASQDDSTAVSGLGGKPDKKGSLEEYNIIPADSRSDQSLLQERGAGPDGAADREIQNRGQRQTAVDTKVDLLEKYVLRAGMKMPTEPLNAAITLVAAQGAGDPEFIKRVLDEFDKACTARPPQPEVKRSLLAVLTKMFSAYGSPRWRRQLAALNPDDLPQSPVPLAAPGASLSRIEADMLARVIRHGREADRSDIDDFVLAVRALHHADGNDFLRDVLTNPESTSPFPEVPAGTRPDGTQPGGGTGAPGGFPGANRADRGKWVDNVGGSWGDAKFHAAVGLAELGETAGVEWLMQRARPNEDGIDGTVWRLPHFRDSRGSLRESSRYSLTDLFGQKPNETYSGLATWWAANKSEFTPRPVALFRRTGGAPSPPADQPATQPPAAATPDEGAKNDSFVPPTTTAAAADLPDLRLEGKQVTVEALAELAGREWAAVTLTDARFNGAIVESLRKAKSIHTLRLFGEDLSGQIPRLKHVQGLVELELGGPLTSGGIQAISELTQLERLVLPQELTINVTGARMLARLVKLKSLGLYNVNLDDASFVELRPLANLEELDLTHTTVTDEGLQAVTGMRHLKRLYLDRYPEKQFPQPQLTDACIGLLAKLPELEDLSLGGKITDEGLKQLAPLPKLRRLSIVHTEITGAGLASLKNSKVEDLVISSSQLNSNRFPVGANPLVLASLRKCHSLKRVMVIGKFYPIPLEGLEKAVPNVSWGFIN